MHPQRTTVPSHERHFYAVTQAFGRFGMRVFPPQVMPASHWHGHVEVNFLTGAAMTYAFDGGDIEVPEGTLVLFWAGLPHQLTRLARQPGSEAELCNIYIPVDAFLFMPHIARLQVAVLGGGIAELDPRLVDRDTIDRWYADYRSNDFERIEVVKMELNALFRRALLDEIRFLRAPLARPGAGREIGPANIRHVITMVRFILDNLAEPITNADVAAATGLHRNYALTLFSRTMKMPLKRFVIRLRLMRARALLVESTTAIAGVAEATGFQSISQFYHHFRAAYGLPPNALRERYVGMSLR
jgi:AraC-like DNA-binding protein